LLSFPAMFLSASTLIHKKFNPSEFMSTRYY
jgi:hypothetical protein